MTIKYESFGIKLTLNFDKMKKTPCINKSH